MRLKNIWAPLFWLLLVFCTWLLLKESTPKPPPFPYFDKLQLAAGFAGLAFSGLKAYPSNPAWILASMAIYGASTEVLQGVLTLSREASTFDWLADMAGVSAAYYFQKFALRYGLRI